MLQIPVAAPYNFDLSLSRLRTFPRQIVARVLPEPAYARAIETGGGLAVVHVTAGGLDDAPHLSVSVTGAPFDAAQLTARLQRAFSANLDLDSFHRHMADADPVMAGLAERLRGLRPIQCFSAWESLVWAICGQQVNLTFAYAMKEALVRLTGQERDGFLSFPSPEAVARLSYEDLTACKFSRSKASFIIDLARAVAEGRVDPEAMVALPTEEAMAALTALRGVGRWTAEVVLLDQGHPDLLPAADIGIRNAVTLFYGLDHQASEAEVRELGQRWAPWRSLASYYLWVGRRLFSPAT